jgi:membrane protein implicated in regulation of membrane protease activity
MHSALAVMYFILAAVLTLIFCIFLIYQIVALRATIEYTKELNKKDKSLDLQFNQVFQEMSGVDDPNPKNKGKVRSIK